MYVCMYVDRASDWLLANLGTENKMNCKDGEKVYIGQKTRPLRGLEMYNNNKKKTRKGRFFLWWKELFIGASVHNFNSTG